MRALKAVFKVLALLLVAGAIALTIAISFNRDCPAPGVAPSGKETFTAVTYGCYGPPEVLELTQVEMPVPTAQQIVVKVHSAGVNPLDWHYMRGSPYIMRLASGIGSPSDTRLGVDFSGTVEAVGAAVTRFKPGDEVFGGANGAFAQYLTVKDTAAIAHKPPNISFAQAGTVGIAGITALQALQDKGQLQPGQKVLVNGASGGVGTFAVQIARAMGAEVTGVSSQRNHELLRSLGASHTIDYKQESYTDGDERYDLIVDNIGNHSPRENSRVLTPNGRLVMVGGASGDWVGPLKNPLLAMVQSPMIDQEVILLMAQLSADGMSQIADLMHSGDVTPMVGRTFPLAAIADAIALSESGRARGKIAIEIPHSD